MAMEALAARSAPRISLRIEIPPGFDCIKRGKGARQRQLPVRPIADSYSRMRASGTLFEPGAIVQ